MQTGNPQVKEAAIKATTYLAKQFTDGYVPPVVLNWNDADDNNAFHAKLMVMDFDGSLSTEVALYHDKEQYNDIMTYGLPLNNDGKPVPAQVNSFGVAIPQGAKNVPVAKEFMKYFSEPKVLNTQLKASLGRWVIPFPEIAKSDPFWLKEDAHVATYVNETLFGPNIPIYEARNPGMGPVGVENAMMRAVINVTKNGMTPQRPRSKRRSSVPRLSWRNSLSLRAEGATMANYPRSAGRPLAGRRHALWDLLRGHLKGSEYLWALAFVIPYLAVFVVFVAYPIVYGLWMGHDPALYKELWADPVYLNTVVNTLIYLGVAVNLEDVYGVPAVGLLCSAGLVGKGAADRLCVALGGAVVADFHLGPLDARRPVGAAQQSRRGSCSASTGRFGWIHIGSRWARSSHPISGNSCRSGP